MNDKLPTPRKIKVKYQALKGEVQSKLGELNNELIKDELSHDILSKKDELVELLLKKYGATKATVLREAGELRGTVSGIIKTAMNTEAVQKAAEEAESKVESEKAAMA